MELEEAERLYNNMVDTLRETRTAKWRNAKDATEKAKYTQKALADYLKMEQTSYSSAELRNTKFSMPRLFAALSYVGVDVTRIVAPEHALLAIDPEQFIQKIIHQSKDIDEVKEELKRQGKTLQEILNYLKNQHKNE